MHRAHHLRHRGAGPVIDLTGKRGLTHAVPRHWEYLAAEWACADDPSEVIGAAHAVENAAKISQEFCLNVVAGMLDVVSPSSSLSPSLSSTSNRCYLRNRALCQTLMAWLYC